jgi:hypothetical protein
MKTLFGAIVVDGRGKLGGHVASKNRHGSYFRTKVSPSQPASTYSANTRARLSTISQAWRGLIEANRILWNNAVADFKKTDIFGAIRNPSGFNLYQMLNNNAANVGASAITTPPQPLAVPSFATFSAVCDNSDGSVTLTFTPAIAATEKVKLFASAAISGGKSFAKSELRQIGVLDSTMTSPYVATTLYAAKFGVVGAVGKKVFFAAEQVKLTTGQAGRKVQCSTVIVA